MANLVAINKAKHSKLKIAEKRDISHIANQHIVSITASEFAKGALSYPVVLIKDPGTERYRSVAMLGLESGENLFFSPDWSALYTPQNVGLLPFALGMDPEKENTLTACIDLDNPTVGEDKEIALFNDDGEESDLFKNIQESLGRLYEAEVMTERFIKEIKEADLLQELELNLALESGEKKKVVGIFSIDEKKLQELSDDKVLDFHKRGMFIPLHAMLGSVAQIHRLVKLRNQNGKNKITNMQINIAEQK